MILADCTDLESDSLEAAVPNNALLTALAKAYAWKEQLESGQFKGLDDIATMNGVDRSYVGRILQLTSLTPDIIESLLAGQTFADISRQRCRRLQVAMNNSLLILTAPSTSRMKASCTSAMG
jgi:hypothetical protein